jgi:hypothetical protein
MRHREIGTVLLLVVVLLAPTCLPCLARASQTTATITTKVRVFQEYKVSVSGLQNAFQYIIEPSEADAPMPVDANGKSFDRFTLTREDGLWLEFPVQVTVDPSAKAYVYHYIIRPVQKNLSDGLYYVDVQSSSLEAGVNEYLLEVHVRPSSVDAAVYIVVPTVHVEQWDGPKVADPGWRIGYKAPDEKPDDTPEEEQDPSSPSRPKPASTPASRTSASNAPLATTGDLLAAGWVAAYASFVGVLLIGWAILRRRKAGDCDA